MEGDGGADADADGEPRPLLAVLLSRPMEPGELCRGVVAWLPSPFPLRRLLEPCPLLGTCAR